LNCAGIAFLPLSSGEALQAIAGGVFNAASSCF
jgi:hypothetical protein